MHAPIFLHADLIIQTNFIFMLDVVVVGAGIVVRNIVLLTTIRKQGFVEQMQKTYIHRNVVRKRKDSNKKNIVEVAIVAIVLDGGRINTKDIYLVVHGILTNYTNSSKKVGIW